MRSRVLWVLITFLVGSCTPSATSIPTVTFTATVSEPTPTISPTATSLPPSEVAYYHIRIEYSTTSDWSTLDWLTPGYVLAIRAMSVTGEQIHTETSVERLALNQTLENAQAGRSISMKVDFALAPEALDQPLEFLLQKGALNSSTIRLYQIVEGEEKLIQKIDHRGAVQSDPGLNPLNFSVDLSPLGEVPPILAQVKSAGREKLVWAFYYPWYHMDSWTYWLKDHPLEWYESGDREVILRHVEQAQGAGIDGFISSWWGPGSDTDQNLEKLLEIADANDFWVTIYFETLAGPDGAPLDETKIYEWLAFAIQKYRDHPAFFKVDGKPLIVIWASNTVPLETWKQVFEKLRTQGLDAVYLAMGYNLSNLEVFDGLHDYGVFTNADLAQTYLTTAQAVRYYTLLADEPMPKIWVATVQPGYDDTLQPSREGLVKEREDGDYYRFTWEAAIQSDPDWVFITTWNEWWEHTHIEPGELYGDQYLQITREYADRWKGK